jgi:hypothetical protein
MVNHKIISHASTKPNPLPFKGRVRVGMGVREDIAKLFIQNNHA